MKNELSELAKGLWKDHGIVLLDMFNSDYKPLHVLRLESRTPYRPWAMLWTSEEPMAVLRGFSSDELKTHIICKDQTIESTSTTQVGGGGAIQALGQVALSLQSATTESYKLCFHSEGVNVKPLSDVIKRHSCVSDHNSYNDLFQKSPGGKTCAVITEVFYAKRLQASSSTETEGNFEGSVSGLPTGTTGAGVHGSKSGSKEVVMSTAGPEQPFAFRFALLVSAGLGKVCQVKYAPNTRLKPMGNLPSDSTCADNIWMEDPPEARRQRHVPNL